MNGGSPEQRKQMKKLRQQSKNFWQAAEQAEADMKRYCRMAENADAEIRILERQIQAVQCVSKGPTPKTLEQS